MKTFSYILIITYLVAIAGTIPARAFDFTQETAIKKNEFIIYPNPVIETGFIKIHLENPTELVVEIFDITGKKIKILNETNIESGEQIIRFDASELNEGIYLCRIKTSNTEKTKRFLVRR
jgi:hypothetical protein